MGGRWRGVVGVLGRLLLVLAGAELLPVVVSLVYGEAVAGLAFLGVALFTAACGVGLALVGSGDGQFYRREGILIVVGGWVLASAFGALPYLAAGTVGSPVDALFESASGFTTTGATILTDIEAVSRTVLFWRSFTQWLGGMGIIVLFVALLPELGPGARFLYKLEVPGPTAEAMHPRIRDTARILWKIYLGLTVVETVLLLLAGLDLYDALTHTFSTLSTGGFSPRADSVAAFASPWVEVIIIVFMVIAGANFSLYYGMRRVGSRLLLFKDPEFRIYLVILVAATGLVLADLLVRADYDHTGRAALDACFQVVSIITTTGFATADFDSWPHVAQLLLVVLMFIGGCAGSTSGSMKIMRMVIGLKSAFREVRLIFSPTTIVRVFVGGQAVPESVVRSVGGFFILYLSIWAGSSVLLTLGGQDLVTCSTATIAVLGNVGPGLAGVGPTMNFAGFAAWQKLLMSLLMWVGRLEVYAIAALFTRAFWRR